MDGAPCFFVSAPSLRFARRCPTHTCQSQAKGSNLKAALDQRWRIFGCAQHSPTSRFFFCFMLRSYDTILGSGGVLGADLVASGEA